MGKFQLYRQTDAMNCGPACLQMISKHYGLEIRIEHLQKLTKTNRQGSNLNNIASAAENLGFRTIGAKVNYSKLVSDAPLPCIIHWNQNHFVVVYKIKNNTLWIADPGQGKRKISSHEFIKNWIGNNADNNTNSGIVLLLEPTPQLNSNSFENTGRKNGLSFLFKYLLPHRSSMIQIGLGLIAASVLQLIFPFLTQSVVDIGIQNQDIGFIYLVLIAQLFLFTGRVAIELIRSWILLHLSTRINIALISDFFIKLMKLPISYFDIKMTGDIMQRIQDHRRIERLLTTQSLNVIFSLFNLVIFGGVLAWYDPSIFLFFLIGSIFYFLWIVLFLKKRKILDYQKFSQMSREQVAVIELINGMQEIKLHNAERQKRWGWEYIQASLLKLSIKSLKLEQIQSIGSNFINEIKNIGISILSAKLVIDGEITLGMMMSISYIIGQLNSPIQQLIGFIYSVQDAKIALERLSEIHSQDDEESDQIIDQLEIKKDQKICLENVSFQYTGAKANVLENLDLVIPARKITAIVGSSGSGKTTLMKIILKFYTPNSGKIKFGSTDLDSISHREWRTKCGVVMQEGYIFNDTVANNIAVGQDSVDFERLYQAVQIANISDFVNELPQNFNTKIGAEGIGLSTGQKQRLLIARAVYKNPDIICFDEATSALDATNERIIMENLNKFFEGRTAIVIAHRLSTVKNADQIVVLDQGRIVEQGTHDQLVKLGGSYFNLVKNQLDLERLNADK